MLIPDHIRCSAKPFHTAAAAVKDYRVCVHALNAGICISKRPYFDDGHKLAQVLLKRGGLLSTIERKLLDKHFGISPFNTTWLDPLWVCPNRQISQIYFPLYQLGHWKKNAQRFSLKYVDTNTLFRKEHHEIDSIQFWLSFFFFSNTATKQRWNVNPNLQTDIVFCDCCHLNSPCCLPPHSPC